ncbi:MAG: hypothetical protein AB8H47_08185 [Bacteroidia bacterium]
MKAQKFWIVLLLLSCSILSLQSQVIKRDGYIITTKGDSLTGIVWTGDTEEACREVKFQVEGGPLRTYSPSELKAYGFGDDQHFLSVLVPRTDKNDVYYGLEIPVFLHQYRSGDVWVYELEHAEGRSLYLGKERDSLKLMHFGLQSVTQEQVRLGVIRLADGTTFTNLTPGAVVMDQSMQRYYFVGGELKLIVPQYQFDLMAVLPANQAPLPANFPLNKPKILQTIEKPYVLQKHNRKPRLQIAVLAYQQLSLIESEEKGSLEGGVLLEARANRFSPKVSLRLGIGRTSWITPKPSGDFFDSDFFMQNIRVGTAYHWLAGKNVRPFVSANAHLIRVSNFGSLEAGVTRFVKPGFSVGVDVYPVKFTQVRIEGGYSALWYVSLSTGLVWTR